MLTLELAGSFKEVVGLDPDAGMIAEAARRAAEVGVGNVAWIQAVAEDIPKLDLGTLRLVTFGQSFHWTDQGVVARAVCDILEPCGAVALIWPTVEGRPEPSGPGYPPIPHDAIRAIIDRYLGPRRRAGQGFRPERGAPYADTLARAGFDVAEPLFAPGRADIVQDVEGVLANYFSTSFAAPHLFGDDQEAFEADVRAELAKRSPDELFWDWPGDTAVLLARKPPERAAGL